MEWHIIGILAFVVIYNIWRYYHEDDNYEYSPVVSDTVNLIWPWCHSFSKFDIDEFARARQVVNDINARGTASVFYSIADSDDVAVHIKKHFLLVPQIPDLEDYMKLMLDCFFRTARTLDLEIEKCRLQECER